MPAVRDLPHQATRRFLTDGGLETSLVFDDRLLLPHLAAFHLLRFRLGQAALVRYYVRYLTIAQNAGFGFVLESPTWRANPDWAGRLGYSKAELAASQVDAVTLMQTIRDRYETPTTPILVSGCVGPRGEGDVRTDADSAETYHDGQIAAMASGGCDLISAMAMTNVSEAVGVSRSACRRGLPCVVTFAVDGEGRLPNGPTLAEAIAEVDAETGAAPAYYMINCAHPSPLMATLEGGRAWMRRLGGLRANASRQSHPALSSAVTLDRGHPEQLAADYRVLADALPRLRVFGGGCGTNHRHVLAIATALTSAAPAESRVSRAATRPNAGSRRPTVAARRTSPKRAAPVSRGVIGPRPSELVLAR